MMMMMMNDNVYGAVIMAIQRQGSPGLSEYYRN